MNKILSFLLILFSSISFSQEYYTANEKLSPLSLSELESKIKDIENNWIKEDFTTIAKVSYQTLKTIKRNDSTINIIKFHFDIEYKSLKKEAVFAFENKHFPGFKLNNLKDDLISSEILKNKISFINIWYVNCAPCIKEMPLLNKLKNKYENDVNFIAITYDSKEKVNKLLEKHDFNFTHLIDAKDFLENKLGITSYPKNIIINKNGIVYYIGGGIPLKFDVTTNKSIELKNEDSKYLEDILQKLLENQ